MLLLLLRHGRKCEDRARPMAVAQCSELENRRRLALPRNSACSLPVPVKPGRIRSTGIAPTGSDKRNQDGGPAQEPTYKIRTQPLALTGRLSSGDGNTKLSRFVASSRQLALKVRAIEQHSHERFSRGPWRAYLIDSVPTGIISAWIKSGDEQLARMCLLRVRSRPLGAQAQSQTVRSNSASKGRGRTRDPPLIFEYAVRLDARDLDAFSIFRCRWGLSGFAHRASGARRSARCDRHLRRPPVEPFATRFRPSRRADRGGGIAPPPGRGT